MHPIFFAYGPRIKNGNVVEPFNTVDLIHLFCEILGIDPPDYVDGERENILHILDELNSSQKMSRWIVISMKIWRFFLICLSSKLTQEVFFILQMEIHHQNSHSN